MELNLSQTNLLQMDAARPHIVTEIKRGVITTLEDRSLTKETAEKYRVEKLFDETDRPIGYAFNYWNEDGTIYAQKVKKLNKMGMQWNGVHDTIPGLFGQSLFPSGGKFITITEGEEDAMAAYQILKAASPSFEPVVVSIVDGAASVEKCCKKAWEYINSFENIILSFDGDEAGIRAAEKISKLFNYRPKVILFSEAKKNKEGAWELKDANDYLKANRSRDFINMWWKADKMTPKGVLTMKSMWQHMIKKDSNTMVPYPWPGATKMLHGLITGHFVVIKAAPKVGKTQILKEIAYHIHTTSPHNVGLIFLENTKKEIGLGLCALHMNKPIKPWEIPDDLAALATAHEFLSQDDRITIFDPEDSRTVENIMAKILYFVKAHNCRYILLDHITMLSYQSGDDNERRFIDKLCADLKELTTSLDICIIAVTHVNDDGKARGSRASAQLCDSTIMLERDKTSDDPIVKNTTKFIVEDNRWGECGTACNLFYNQTDGRMTELDFDLETGADKERTVEFDK
jgi:twinkle protein